MEIIHRFDSKDRQHYLFREHQSFKLKPRLLYVGQMNKSKGWTEKPHTHPYCEIIFIPSGSGVTNIDGTEHKINKGDIIIYNAGVEHFEASSLNEPLEMLFFAFDNFEITDIKKNHLLPPDYNCIYPANENYSQFINAFNEIIREHELKNSFFAEVSQNIARNMIMQIIRIINRTDSESELLKSHKVLSLATTYIHTNFKSNITLEMVADNCYINKYYLSHLFTKIKGISVGKYILDLRLAEARNLLSSTPLSISEVAELSGFNDTGYFCRTFKKYHAVTPMQYRKEHRRI